MSMRRNRERKLHNGSSLLRKGVEKEGKNQANCAECGWLKWDRTQLTWWWVGQSQARPGSRGEGSERRKAACCELAIEELTVNP